jgi:hypothetical protein
MLTGGIVGGVEPPLAHHTRPAQDRSHNPGAGHGARARGTACCPPSSYGSQKAVATCWANIASAHHSGLERRPFHRAEASTLGDSSGIICPSRTPSSKPLGRPLPLTFSRVIIATIAPHSHRLRFRHLKRGPKT